MDAAITELKRILFQTNLHEQMAKKIQARVATYKVKTNDERAALTKELARVSSDMNRLLAFLKTTDPTTMPGAFDAVRGSMEAAAQERKVIEGKLAALQPQAAPRLPTVGEIQTFVSDVEARLRDDPTATREALRLALDDGRIVLHPQPDGTWLAVSSIVFGKLAGTRASRRSSGGSKTVTHANDDKSPRTTKPRQGEPSGASSVISPTGEVVEIGSCAGRIHPIYTAVRIPMEVRIAA